MNKFILYILFVVAISLFISSCGIREIPTPVGETSQPSPTLSSPEKTSLLPSPTLVPTLTASDSDQLYQLLHQETCILPCYLGIIPGATTMSEAHSILKSLGASFRDEKNKPDGTIETIFDLDIGDPLVPKTTPGSSALVYQNFYLRGNSNEDIVASIHLGIGTENTKVSFELYRKYWKRYSVKQIFSQLGPPDQLFTTSKRRGYGVGSALIMVYEQYGVYIDLRGTGHETSICSDNEAQNISLQIDLFDQGSSLNTDKLNPYLNDPTVWLPIKDALGIDGREFHRLVVTYPSVCFLY